MRFTDNGDVLIDVPYCVVHSGDRFAVSLPPEINRDSVKDIVAYLQGLAKEEILRGAAKPVETEVSAPVDDFLDFFDWRFADDDDGFPVDDDGE